MFGTIIVSCFMYGQIDVNITKSLQFVNLFFRKKRI